MNAEIPAEAQWYKDKVIIWDEAQASQIHQQGSAGKPLSGGKLQLSPIETLFLLDKEKIVVKDKRTGRKLDSNKLTSKLSKLDPDLLLKYSVYSDLRSRGYVVKTGLKFGTHFRLYERGARPGEGHAPYLVHAIPEGSRMTPADLARAVRLAHSVRKKMMFAIVDDEGDITYYSLSRETP